MHDEMKFTKSDILELIGLTPKLYETWVQKGIIVPAGEEGGFRTFTLMQAIGIAVAWTQYTGDQGCHLDYVKRVIAAFARTTEMDLLKRFADGAVVLANASHTDGPVLTSDGEQWGYVNVKTVYQEVLARIEELAAVNSGTRAGRRRGSHSKN